ncbi:brain acid soluble protein 1 [Paralichthys olivaceus]|uniref:brain acid soluble protein 1 n=1 Tax=Paralichthys olivaceus TaxID=8255 RepID=UPI003753AD52
MMSYLWILLLGSLLATSAKAQEEEAAPENPSFEPAAAPEVNAEPKETAEEIQPSVSAPESNAEPEAGADQPADDAEPAAPATEDAEPAAPATEDAEPAAPATEDAEPAAPATEDAEPAAPAAPAAEDADAATPAAPAAEDTEAATPATEDTEPAAPAAEDTEPAAPAAEDTEPAAPAAEDTEAATPAAPAAEDTDAEEATPAAADTEADAAATREEPTADPEVKDPEAEQPAENAEEESTAGSDPTVAPVESGSDDEATPTTDVAADDNQEQPTDAKPEVAIVEENILPEVRTGVKAIVPSDKKEGADTMNAAPVAGTKEDDKPQAQEASSSSLAGILCGIAVAAVGSVVGYFTYQKKKLCFKNRQEADPEAARKADTAEANSDPQVLSNLLNSS